MFNILGDKHTKKNLKKKLLFRLGLCFHIQWKILLFRLCLCFTTTINIDLIDKFYKVSKTIRKKLFL